jgi:hypothetical protein
LWSGSSWETIYRCDRPNEDVQARLPECGLRLPKVVDMEQGAAQRYGMVVRISGDGLRDNSGDGLRVKPSPRELATIRTHAPPGCAPAIANYHSTFGDVDDRPGTHPLHRFGQPGVDQSKTSVRLCGTQPRATRANRAQSTAHH